MNDPYPSSKSADRPRSLLERLSDFISPEPDSRAELLEVLQDAHARNLIDADSLSMIEGVFQVSELTARDIMVPRGQMDTVNIADAPESFIPFMRQTAHSRFPVYEGSRDNIIGILLAKDLLRYYTDEEFDLRETLRPAVFIPESKRLNILLRDFRINRNHIAMVVDEYGGVAGLVTIEDLLEQIVGNIRDEHEVDVPIEEPQREPHGVWLVPGSFPVNQLPSLFGEQAGLADLDEAYEATTLGGLVSEIEGRIPLAGEVVMLEPLGLRLEIVVSTDRRVDRLRVFPPVKPVIEIG